LMEKLSAYQLQDRGLDTIEANLRLGHAVDLRDYALSVRILRFLKVRSLQLMTNNPAKIRAVRSSGIEIATRVGANVPSNPYSAHYVAIKRDKLGHLNNSATGSLIAGDYSDHSTSTAASDRAAGFDAVTRGPVLIANCQGRTLS
jgi:hypothetical protein